MRPDLVPDAELGYERSRTAFRPGAGLALDEAYRLAHLPLVAPDHPDAIARLPGRDYERGRHGTVHSLVLPIDADALEASEPYRALEAELRASRLAAKLDWSLPPRRRARLHATICGSLSREAPPVLDDAPCRHSGAPKASPEPTTGLDRKLRPCRTVSPGRGFQDQPCGLPRNDGRGHRRPSAPYSTSFNSFSSTSSTRRRSPPRLSTRPEDATTA